MPAMAPSVSLESFFDVLNFLRFSPKALPYSTFLIFTYMKMTQNEKIIHVKFDVI